MRTTIRAKLLSVIGCSLVLVGFSAGNATSARGADDDAAPSAYLMLTGNEELLSDAKYLLDLTTPIEQKQWPVLKSYLEVFLIGVDSKLPTRVEVHFDAKANRFVWSVPVANMKKFRNDNVKAIITPRIREVGPNLFKLGSGRQGDFNGYMLSTPPYVHIGETQEDVKGVPADPRSLLAPLLARHFFAAVDIQNKKTDAPSQAKRRELFQSTRKQTLGALKKEKGETPADFELRKKATEIELDEGEWFFAESEHAQIGLQLDREGGLGRAELELTPIAGTPLAQSVEQLQTKPSRFANIESNPDPVLSVRLNHPLSEVRKKSAAALAGLIKDRLKARADADEKLAADAKQATKQLIDKTFELLDAGIKAGIADGFIDVHKAASGKNVLLAGVRSPDGTKIDEILALVPKAGAGEQPKLNVAEESGVKIHSIEVTKDKHPRWSDFIGATTVYVGSSKDVVWCAAGEGALDALKAAIKKAAQPPAAGAEKAPWGELIVRLKPWVDELNSQPPKKKGEDHYRKMLSTSFEGGDDRLSVRMTRQQNKILGEIVVQKGILRFAGKAASDFSRDNLDETSQKSPKQARKNDR